LTRHERLLRLERHVRDTGIALNDDQVRTLGRFSPEFRERHIETRCSGDLVAVDTFFVGTLKGVGKIYLQSAIDCHSRYAFGRLYTSKLPVTAVHMLNESVLPFFEEHDTPVVTVLSDNGREFCGRPDRHSYELFLHWRVSNIGQPGSGARKVTALWNDCTEHCSMSISEFRGAGTGTSPWTKCSRTLTPTCATITTSGHTKAET